MVIEQLSNKKLNQIIHQIDSDQQLKNLYESKWHKIVNFISDDTQYKNARISKTGSLGKKTVHKKSDLDVIFSVSQNYHKQEVLNHVKAKANDKFDEIANVYKTSNAVYVDFYHPECKVDIVLVSPDKFDAEHEEVKDIRTLLQIQQNAIKIVKFAFDKVLGKHNDIKGHEVEKACLLANFKSVREYVYFLLKYFRGRNIQQGLSLEEIINFIALF
jgi:hypothetical protein